MKTINIYTDGSYNPKTGIAGYAFVAISEDNNIIYQQNKQCENEIYYGSRQIIGEMEAVMNGVKWAIANGYDNIVINYDYMGLSCWLTGQWKTKKPISKFYKSFFTESMLSKISFVKVKAHSDNKWNNYVDGLAKDAINVKR